MFSILKKILVFLMICSFLSFEQAAQANLIDTNTQTLMEEDLASQGISDSDLAPEKDKNAAYYILIYGCPIFGLVTMAFVFRSKMSSSGIDFYSDVV